MENKRIVKEIIIYPVKGLRGISVPSSHVDQNGLRHDRIYMVVDANGLLVSQRTNNVMALMNVSQDESGWTVTFRGDMLTIPDQAMSESQMEVEIWEALFTCNEVSETCSDWFSKHLGMECRLMIMPNQKTRLKEFNKPPFKTFLSFADGYPILTLGTESVNHLNNKLTIPIHENRFRANVIIETSIPHEEDLWNDFKIGDQVILRNIKPCVRCEVITIDQESGKKGKEPLKTLAIYRKEENGVCFGSNAISIELGQISVGDVIQLFDKE